MEKMEQIEDALHDLCQPIATLQVRLELAGMLNTPEAYREAVDVALVECGKLMDAVISMRGVMRAIS
jgi:hypothetical protein